MSAPRKQFASAIEPTETVDIGPPSQTSSDRLMDIALRALAAYPRQWDRVRVAILRSVRHDPDLLWALLDPYRSVAVQRLMAQAAQVVRAGEMTDDRSRVCIENRKVYAPIVRQGGAGRGDRDHPSESARSTSQRAGMAAVANVARASILDLFVINGRKIGDCTPAEARGWASARRRDVRFVEMMIANLPDGEPIRRWRTADEADALYRMAQEAHHD
jgi:hypothetical protein